MTDILKKTILKLENQKKYAWCFYFNMRENFFDHIFTQEQQIQKIVDKMNDMDQSSIPPEFVELIADITNIAVKNQEFLKCPICMNLLYKDTITSSKCGHLYCNNCYKQLLKTKKCAICRKTL